MTDRERIEEACNTQMLGIAGWDEDNDDGITAKLGRWVVVTPEYDDDGQYEGDVGELTACKVGAEKYGNERVVFSFTPDGTDGGIVIVDFSALDAAD